MTIEEKREFVLNYCKKIVKSRSCDGCSLKHREWKSPRCNNYWECLYIMDSNEEDLDKAIKLIEESNELDKAHDTSKLAFVIPNEPTIPPMPKVNKSDSINHPKHYQGKNECIDVMLAMFGVEAVKHFCMCNAYKYRFRSNMKNGEEDIKKAEWYEDKLINLERGRNNG